MHAGTRSTIYHARGETTPDPRGQRGEDPIDTSPHITPPVYVTGDLPPLGGRIKETPEDFLVEELPLYAPSGEGEHIYLFVEKRGMNAMEMFGLIARHFGVRRSAIGYAGLKDKQAITRQVVSVHTPGKTVDDFPHFQHDRVRILWADQHDNKLRRGHLAGNRFSIKIRGVEPTAVRTALAAIRKLEEMGVPERFGPQRFGYLANNHLIGQAILAHDATAALDLLLGPNPRSPENQARARELYAAGDLKAARDAFPRSFRTERVALVALANGESPEQAIDAIDPDVLGFYISAFQSAVFNAVLDRRIVEGTFGRLLEGDITVTHAGRHPTLVDEVNLADPAFLARYGAMEFCASGPMWGRKMMRAGGVPDAMEVEALDAFGFTPDTLPDPAAFDVPMIGGTRRPLRCPITSTEVEGGSDEIGPYIRVAFDLPRGAFATAVLEEIMKTGRAGDEDTA
jgi:tRNA pseudouridine13 synthase